MPYACHPNRTPRRPFLGPSSMTLTQLRYLVAIAASGLNIPLAAERVHATQPGLSTHINQLADSLGYQLFLRTCRSLQGISPPRPPVLRPPQSPANATATQQ